MLTKVRAIGLLLSVLGLSLFWSSGVSVAGTVTTGESRELRDPNDCLDTFDVWTSENGNTHIAYYGSKLPLVNNPGTLKIWADGVHLVDWGVRKSTHYDAKNLQAHGGETIYVELHESWYIRCSGYYQA
ncbi:hypothetical protein [Microlunatus sp. GCM10028923]|uniref:hypothetical protein n=1 Tax=Microlunatus sp. GCM10028923 TaxID=3273400 RepID=UPI003614323B